MKFVRRKEDIGPCYNCKNSGHIITNCPPLKVTSKKLHKKKAMVATWDDSESKSEEEVDITNMCFMANDEHSTRA